MMRRMLYSISAFLNRTSVPLFVVLTLCFGVPGIVGMTVLDIGHTPDVWTHVYRVSSILNGDLVARPVGAISRYHSNASENVGGAVDRDLVELSIEFYGNHDPGSVLSESVDWSTGDRVDVPFNNTAVYSPFAYLPQLLGFSLADVFGLNAVSTYYFGQAVMLLVWSILGASSVIMMPQYKGVMVAMLLFPATWMPTSFAISADSFSLILCFLFAALVYRAIVLKPLVGLSIAIGIVGCLMAISKFSNAPLFMIACSIPFVRGLKSNISTNCAQQRGSQPFGLIKSSYREAFSRSTFGFMWITIFFLIAVIIDVLWLLWGASGFTTSPSIVSYEIVQARSHDIQGSIGTFLSAWFYSVIHVQGAYLFGREGVAVFWMGLILGFIACTFVLLMSFAYDRSNGFQPLSQLQLQSWRLAFFCLWCCIVICVAALISYWALWSQYTPPGNLGVDGVQYRYFLPYLPFGGIVVAQIIGLICYLRQAIAGRG